MLRRQQLLKICCAPLPWNDYPIVAPTSSSTRESLVPRRTASTFWEGKILGIKSMIFFVLQLDAKLQRTKNVLCLSYDPPRPEVVDRPFFRPQGQ